MPSVARILTPPLAELRARRSEKWADLPPDVLPATVAEMDFALAPPVAAALRAAVERSDLGYLPPSPRRLTEAFTAWAARRLRWRVDPEQVAVTPDVMAGIVALCAGLARAGRRPAVAFATPNYPPYFRELPAAGFSIHPIALTADGALDLDALDTTLAEGVPILLLANPHNPLGRVVPRGELAAIAELCAARDAWVIADEIHAPLTLAGAEPTPWLEVSDAARERGIALTSASKAFNLAALKCAVLVTASARARDAVAAMPPQSDHAGLLGLIAAEAAFRDGDAWLDGLLEVLAANRSLLVERLGGLAGVRFAPPEASYLAWLDLREAGLGADPAAALLERGRLAVHAGDPYGAPGFVRLNFGTAPELVAEMADRVAATL